MTPLKTVIQGIPGAFHHIAANKYFPGRDLELVPARTFEDLVEQVPHNDAALMAIENTIAGSLLNNYQLLNLSKLHITGEVYLRIQQNLLVLNGTPIEELREVYSHPVAITQCRKFFRDYPKVKLIETEDTAQSAQMVADRGKRKIGAIASTLAGELYGLEVAAASIETYKRNHTRFLVLSDSPNEALPPHPKVSLCFALSHRIGSLAQILTTLAIHRANLTKIQSVPMLDTNFEYLFFVDFLLDQPEDLEGILSVLDRHVSWLRLLGVYSKGLREED